MTREEAKEIFLNRGFINGIFDGDKWRQSVAVISDWLMRESKIGHWVDGDKTRWKCSNCGYGVLDWNNTPYCPNCGADMQKEQNNG